MTGLLSGSGRPSDCDRTSGDLADPLIRVEDVSVAYGDVPVIRGASLSVAAGEFVGLVGPNGAGKTTLLKTINGVLSPDEGRVVVAGADVHDLSSRSASRRIATVPQTTTVAFDFSVEDVVAMGRTPYHGRFSPDPDAAGAVERALERTETAQFRDRAVGSLSGGERQRVLLARALAQETPALVLDEPTANLDINHQIGTLELVRDLVDDATAALAAIHDLDLAARFCDRLALLADGAILSAGPPDRVLRDGPLTAAFGIETAVLSNPVTGTPTVTPVLDAEPRPETCHVVGTGRAAARAVAALSRSGFTVTAGAVPAGDVAALTAQQLAAETVTLPAFAGLDADTVATVRRCLDRADVAVLAGSVPPALGDVVAESGAVTVDVESAVTVESSVERHLDLDERDAETGRDIGGDGDGDRAGDEDGHGSRSLVARVRRAIEDPIGADD